MNKKQKIIVSIVGITIVLLALLGLTYAYYLTRIQGNTNTNSISVTTANLELRYDDLTENITLDGAMPNTTKTKQFTVINNGNAKVNDYHVYLENVVNELERKDDLVYTLTCSTNDETNSPCTNEIDEETTFPSINGIVLTNSLDTNDVHTYILTLTYKEMNVDQSIDMGKVISAKINLYDSNTLNTLTLGHYILENGAQVEESEFETVLDYNCILEMGETFCKNNNYTVEIAKGNGNIEHKKIYTEKTEITKASDGTDMSDVGIFTALDDYGTSYYYRGTVKNNYVGFAGFTWRIVRINGDGSIRLILDEALNKICVEYNEDNTCKIYAGTKSAFNSIINDNAYIGYMYGFTGGTTNKCLTKDVNNEYTVDSSITYTIKEECETAGGRWASTPYETTHINKNSSTIKIKIDAFYETYIENGTTKQYEKYLADSIFCGDKSLASSNINSGTGYGTSVTKYAAYERLGYNNKSIVNPTLKCAENEPNTYSRYTVEEQNRNNVYTNGDLKHPIALLSADELVFAGAFIEKYNTEFYLNNYENKNELNSWWNLTPSNYNLLAENFILGKNLMPNKITNFETDYPSGIRPVINLKSNLLIESGDGTQSGPYVLKEIS